MNSVHSHTRAERRAIQRKQVKAQKRARALAVGAVGIIAVTSTISPAIADGRQEGSTQHLTAQVKEQLAKKTVGEIVIDPNGTAAAEIAELVGVSIDFAEATRLTNEANNRGEIQNFDVLLVQPTFNEAELRQSNPELQYLTTDGSPRQGFFMTVAKTNISTADKAPTTGLADGETHWQDISNGDFKLFGHPELNNTDDRASGTPEGAFWVADAYPTHSTYDGGVADDSGMDEGSRYDSTTLVDEYAPTPERLAHLNQTNQRSHNPATLVNCLNDGTQCGFYLQVHYAGVGTGTVFGADGTVYGSVEEVPEGVQYRVDEGARTVAVSKSIFVPVATTRQSVLPEHVGIANAVLGANGNKGYVAPVSSPLEVGSYIYDNGTGGRTGFNPLDLTNELVDGPAESEATQTASIELSSNASTEPNGYEVFNISGSWLTSDPNTQVDGQVYSAHVASATDAQTASKDVLGRIVVEPVADAPAGGNQVKTFSYKASINDPRYRDGWVVPADLTTGRVVDFNGHQATIKVVQNGLVNDGITNPWDSTTSSEVVFSITFDTVPEEDFVFATDLMPWEIGGRIASPRANTDQVITPGYKVQVASGSTSVELNPTAEAITGSSKGEAITLDLGAGDSAGAEGQEILSQSYLIEDPTDGVAKKTIKLEGKGSIVVSEIEAIAVFTPDADFDGKLPTLQKKFLSAVTGSGLETLTSEQAWATASQGETTANNVIHSLSWFANGVAEDELVVFLPAGLDHGATKQSIVPEADGSFTVTLDGADDKKFVKTNGTEYAVGEQITFDVNMDSFSKLYEHTADGSTGGPISATVLANENGKLTLNVAYTDLAENPAKSLTLGFPSEEAGYGIASNTVDISVVREKKETPELPPPPREEIPEVPELPPVQEEIVPEPEIPEEPPVQEEEIPTPDISTFIPDEPVKVPDTPDSSTQTDSSEEDSGAFSDFAEEDSAATGINAKPLLVGGSLALLLSIGGWLGLRNRNKADVTD